MREVWQAGVACWLAEGRKCQGRKPVRASWKQRSGMLIGLHKMHTSGVKALLPVDMLHLSSHHGDKH